MRATESRKKWDWAIPVVFLLIAFGLFITLRNEVQPEERLFTSQETHGGLTLAFITPTEMGPYAPEDLLSYSFELKNDSDRPHTYEVTSESPESWHILSQYAPVTLQSAEVTRLFASWLIPPWIPAQDYRLVLSLRSEDDAQTGKLELKVPVRATPRPRIRVERDRPQITAGSSDVLKMDVENRGNASGNFVITVSAPSGWQVALVPSTLTLEPHKQASIEAKIQVPPSTAWGPYSLTFKAQSSGFENQLSLTVSVLPGP